MNCQIQVWVSEKYIVLHKCIYQKKTCWHILDFIQITEVFLANIYSEQVPILFKQI